MAGEKILNIDDSPTVQRLIEMILSSEGYQVVLASDGEAGIAKAKAEKPAVILVDFVMPKMNGFQVCKALKEDPEFKDTPIILVTSKGDTVGSKFVDVLGITEYFTKPFQPEDLLARIRDVIDKKGKPLPGSKGEAGKSSSSLPSAEAETPLPGFENTVRQLVETILNDFIKKSLPGLIRAELAKPDPRSHAGVQGNLETCRIAEVMQMLELQRQTGRLSISRSDDGAEIYFRDGSIVLATSLCDESKPALEGLLRITCKLQESSLEHVRRIVEMTNQPIDTVLAKEKLMDLPTFGEKVRSHTESTVYKAMAWREGTFFFEKTTPPLLTTSLPMKVEDLLLEGARRADEWTLIQQRIPNFSLVFEPMIGNAEELTTRGMSDVDVKVFSLIDGRRTVQEIIDGSSLDEFEVAKSMFILLSVNLIRKKK